MADAFFPIHWESIFFTGLFSANTDLGIAILIVFCKIFNIMCPKREMMRCVNLYIRI